MTASKSAATARITEIFSSVQGEGPRMGERQIFIRFESCHMECAYCDEGSRLGRSMSLPDVLKDVNEIEKSSGPHRVVSLTGGEPLLQVGFLKCLCRELKRQHYQILLETSGVLWKSFSKVVRDCDIIAMDLKLPSVTRQRDFLEEHRKFLRFAKSKEAYVKVVASRKVSHSEYEKHIRMVASVAPGLTVFLQPMSCGKAAIPRPELIHLLLKLQRIGAKWLPDIRLGIQLHKLINVR